MSSADPRSAGHKPTLPGRHGANDPPASRPNLIRAMMKKESTVLNVFYAGAPEETYRYDEAHADPPERQTARSGASLLATPTLSSRRIHSK
ncbi:hypothetical protein ACFXHA_11100 [Nocardia sp. NPDC059240]|uniref:hypothetical protein n=1 Tax=Nocardia sp. NPDC059240 TaxID=3346786 RepID=UPI0036B4C33A